jgi:hypothetical protein
MPSLLLVTTGTWIDPDGISQPAGTVVNRIAWDGVSTYTPPPGFAFRTDLKESIWRSLPGPFRQSLAELLDRFTQPEKIALYAARTSAWQVDDVLTKLAAGGPIEANEPRMVVYMTALVTRGVLTAPRAAAILAGSP